MFPWFILLWTTSCHFLSYWTSTLFQHPHFQLTTSLSFAEKFWKQRTSAYLYHHFILLCAFVLPSLISFDEIPSKGKLLLCIRFLSFLAYSRRLLQFSPFSPESSNLLPLQHHFSLEYKHVSLFLSMYVYKTNLLLTLLLQPLLYLFPSLFSNTPTTSSFPLPISLGPTLIIFFISI